MLFLNVVFKMFELTMCVSFANIPCVYWIVCNYLHFSFSILSTTSLLHVFTTYINKVLNQLCQFQTTDQRFSSQAHDPLTVLLHVTVQVLIFQLYAEAELTCC